MLVVINVLAAQQRIFTARANGESAAVCHVPKPAKCCAARALVIGLCYTAEVLAASASGPLTSSHVAGQSFRDCNAYCPEMIVLPPGRFIIGSPIREVGRGSDENPQKVVIIGYALAVGKYPVTRREFAAFVADTGRKLSSCEHWDGKTFRLEQDTYWSNAFHQTDNHPVVCVNWDDSQAYARWLSRKTGRRYRLLSEAEWEYSARAGTTTAWYWGDNDREQCLYANGADLSAKARGVTTAGFASCDDKYPHTSPVGSFRPNKFGLYDMAGNVGEWVEDCYHDTYRDTPNNGSALETCIPKFHEARVMRGGAWNAIPAWMRSASRDVELPSLRADTFGFRVARTD